MAVAYGMPKEEAVRAISLGAAEILGIDHELGSLEPGKIADLVMDSIGKLGENIHIRRFSRFELGG